MARWWAQAPLASLLVDLAADTDAAIYSLVHMLERPGLCAGLRVFQFGLSGQEDNAVIRSDAYRRILFNLWFCAPQLRTLRLFDIGSGDLVGDLGFFSEVRELFISCVSYPQPRPLTLSEFPPRLETLYIRDVSPDPRGVRISPRRPLPSVHTLIIQHPVRVTKWHHFPNLSTLSTFAVPRHPVRLEPFASSLRALHLESTLPTAIKAPVLPNLEVLTCVPATLTHLLPSLRHTLTTLRLYPRDIHNQNLFAFPILSDAAVNTLAGLPALRSLIYVFYMKLLTPPQLRHLLEVQRRLPHCHVSSEHEDEHDLFVSALHL